LLKGSALGAGALLGAAGLQSVAKAATPEVTAAAIGDGGAAYTLKIDSVTVPLSSFSFGVSRHASEGRAAGGQTSAGQIHITVPSTKLSPTLMLNTVSGKTLGSATITGTVDEGRETFLKVDLSEVFVSSYELESVAENTPTENITLSYGKISYSFSDQNEAGAWTTATSVWNVRTAKFSSA